MGLGTVLFVEVVNLLKEMEAASLWTSHPSDGCALLPQLFKITSF
jgi:hypothetical protein